MKTIGIIGHKGFVGSALFERLHIANEYGVTGIGRQEYSTNTGSHFDILINADGNSSKFLASKNPLKDFQMNVDTTIEIAQDFSCDLFVHISSVDVYNLMGNSSRTREDEAIEPVSLSNYGFSKYCAEQVVKRFAKKWLILRLGGMVGAGMKKGPVFDILESSKLYVHPDSLYQFINTSEVAEIILQLIKRETSNEIFNIAGTGQIRLSEIAKLANVELSEYGADIQNLNISNAKIGKLFTLSTTKETIKQYLESRKQIT